MVVVGEAVKLVMAAGLTVLYFYVRDVNATLAFLLVMCVIAAPFLKMSVKVAMAEDSKVSQEDDRRSYGQVQHRGYRNSYDI